ncbi:MAG: 4-hydroxythreonine-4-phosphate dehydrogenase PdxA [Prevotellaceae bacterium]|jgi:4-hydroxythreonine-4-phosphate dehydrogenase|nr:4-hydroxythreonine-4-phosphate dehydrogenase PdxA [Prevotellaceae bacterium]
MKDDKLRIGITHGDINGISYEIILKTLADTRINDFFTPIVYGSSKVAAFYRKHLNVENFSFNAINSADDANPKRANMINITADDIRVELGKITEMAGDASVAALRAGVKDLKNHKIDAIVTCPINKSNIQSGNYNFPGHTEFFASEFDVKDYMMLMISNTMRIGFVTSHIPLEDVSKTLSKDLIIHKIDIITKSMIVDFMIHKPHIAVLALNPHAGDNGLIGKEENKIIIPAVDECKEKGMLVYGPYPADGFFASAMFNQFDAVLAMYHDQGMIPFKSLSYDGGVNYTAGLPVIRTSPTHGTAYDIAGENKASIDSFREALYMACKIYKNRTLHAELTAAPLKKVDPESIL